MTQRLVLALIFGLGLFLSPVFAQSSQSTSADSQEQLTDWQRRELERQQRKRMEARRCISDWRLGLCSRSYREPLHRGSRVGDVSGVSVALIALGLSATWVVLFYGFTRTTRYETERTQMNRVRRQVMAALRDRVE